MRQVILNADDFGRHALINEAVRRAAADGLLRSASLMAGEPAVLLEAFINMMLTSIFSIKNPGFIEEREWRLIYQDTAGSTLASDIVSVDGIPQVIYKLPWRAVGESGAGLPIADALEQIIIGPSQYADVIEVAFTHCLSELGIADAGKRVVKSNIPLR